MWRNFSQLNDITGLMEDDPDIATFSCGKTGFVVPPTDYNVRPGWLGHSLQYIDWRRHNQKCLGGGVTSTVVLLRNLQFA